MDECWKDVASHEGRYQVSSLGRVRSLDRFDSRGKRFVKGRVLRFGHNKQGYPLVGLSYATHHTTRLVHRLVAEAFLPNPEQKREVNHLDAIKANNRVDNLVWVTPEENRQHATLMGLDRKGEIHGNALFTEDDVRTIIHRLQSGEPRYRIRKDYPHVSTAAISDIALNRSWQHIPREKMLEKRQGEHSSSSKLTEQIIRDIRRRVAAGEVQRDLAREYHISPATITKIIFRRRWQHIP